MGAKVDEIAETVRRFLLDEVFTDTSPQDLDDTTALISSGLLDSLSTLQMVGFLEDRYGVTIAAHEASVARMDSLADIARLVRSKQG